VTVHPGDDFTRVIIKNQSEEIGQGSAISSMATQYRRGVAAPGFDPRRSFAGQPRSRRIAEISGEVKTFTAFIGASE
jgi:hypothetical protein